MTITPLTLQCPCGHATTHNCPIDWTDGKYLQPSAPGRHTVDTITDPVLHRLYDERDMYARDWTTAETLREQAEAAILRVRAWCDDLDATMQRLTGEPAAAHPVAANVRHLLDPPKES